MKSFRPEKYCALEKWTNREVFKGKKVKLLLTIKKAKIKKKLSKLKCDLWAMNVNILLLWRQKVV